MTSTMATGSFLWRRATRSVVVAWAILLGLVLGVAPAQERENDGDESSAEAAEQDDDDNDNDDNDNDDNDNDEQEAEPSSPDNEGSEEQGVTARYGDDEVRVPALWVVIHGDESDEALEVVDPLTDRVRLAYYHPAVPAELGVRLWLRVQHAQVAEAEGQAGDYRELEKIELPGPHTESRSSVETFDWAPWKAGHHRFQVVLEVTDIPEPRPGEPRPNPERMRAASSWHECTVSFAEEEPELSVVDTTLEMRWLDEGPSASETRMAEVTLRLELRARETAILVPSSRFEYAEPLEARWRALLPPAGEWHHHEPREVTPGERLQIERRYRFAAAHWPRTLTFRLERKKEESAAKHRFARVELALAEPGAPAVEGTLTRYAPSERTSDLAPVMPRGQE